jgi:hypothetical protein
LKTTSKKCNIIGKLEYCDREGLSDLKNITELIIRKIFGDNSDYLKKWSVITFSPMVIGPTSETLKTNAWNEGKTDALSLYKTMLEDIKWSNK